ncbi:hypothetical protein SAMN02745215_05011 [Desulfitobacterium chlororespirans DSM 11544]|uniref:Uncharacterized protein n=1 Tax=Desulfitobacterium chlororespirans DSM 11544 TaxID=1121395 RepID=A0A1M7UY58_9FIRM|nr:hypothetical protein SAMN02745215_05011 [Desulfitobacterium chlororespirans DSM 11544]
MLLCLLSSPFAFFIGSSIYIILTITVGLHSADLAAFMSIVMIVLLLVLGLKKFKDK